MRKFRIKENFCGVFFLQERKLFRWVNVECGRYKVCDRNELTALKKAHTYILNNVVNLSLNVDYYKQKIPPGNE